MIGISIGIVHIGVTEGTIRIKVIIQIEIDVLAFLFLGAATAYNVFAVGKLREGARCIRRNACIIPFLCRFIVPSPTI